MFALPALILLFSVTAASGSPVLLTHNDAQPGNWMNPGALASFVPSATKTPLELIDYEYAGLNYRGFEFGNLFCEFGFNNQATVEPFFTFDAAKCPSEAVMRDMFAVYAANVTGPATRAGNFDSVCTSVCVCAASV